MNNSMHQVECTVPVLQVRNLPRSVAFYTDTLGFAVDWIGEQKLAGCVSRDGCSIMLRQPNQWTGPS